MSRSQQGSSVKMSAPPMTTGHGSGSGSSNGGGRQGARSSRRKVGSTGPQVVLGGGAGILGQKYKEAQYSNSPFYTESTSPRTTSAQYPVTFNSPSQPSFPSPISPQFPNMYRAPSPLPPPKETNQSVVKEQDRRSKIPEEAASGSSSSLSTTASTSSRTLKTPHSKLDHAYGHSHQPSIVSSTDSHGSGTGFSPHQDRYNGSPPSMPKNLTLQLEERKELRSPTPTQASLSQPGNTVDFTKSPETRKPEPETKAVTRESSVHPSVSEVRRQSPPQPRQSPPYLDLTKANHRLSQDWVQIDFPAPKMLQPAKLKSLSPPMEKSFSAPQRAAPLPPRSDLPKAQMIPMKATSPSPSRPNFERSNTAPPLSPPSESKQFDGAQSQQNIRGSLDQLRSTSTPNAIPTRARQHSHSTPPSSVLDRAASSSPSRHSSLLRDATTRRSPPTGEAGGGRASMSISRVAGKSAQQEQQRALGVSSGRATPSQAVVPEADRKLSGLSLKKSSGALKALFNRGASGKGGKEQSQTPPLPSNPTFNHQARPRPSTSSGRPSIGARPSTPGSSSSPIGAKIPIKPGSEIIPSQSTFVTDKSTWPSASGSSSMMRTRSQGQQPQLKSQVLLPSKSADSPSSQQQRPSGSGSESGYAAPVPGRRVPDRDLPTLPFPSPVNPKFVIDEAKRIGNEALSKLDNETPLDVKLSTLSDALPDSALPYLSPLASTFGLKDEPSTGKLSAGSAGSASNGSRIGSGSGRTSDSSPNSFVTAQSRSSSKDRLLEEFERAASGRSQDAATAGYRLPPSTSLHLLQLPSLDLDLDLSFDKIGHTPTTPHKPSPVKVRRSPHSPGSPTPVRSLSTKVYSPRVSPLVSRSRRNSDGYNTLEKRRSKSFDGPLSGLTLDELWRDTGDDRGMYISPSMANLYNTASSSAPVYSVPLEPTSSDDSVVSSTSSPSTSSTVTARPQVLPTHNSAYSAGSQRDLDRQVSEEGASSRPYARLPRRQGSSSDQSAPSSSDHARTPSGTTSTNETDSPSPPRTPPSLEHRSLNSSAVSMGFSPEDMSTPKAPNLDNAVLAAPIVISEPPSIPLPSPPTQTSHAPTSLSTIPIAATAALHQVLQAETASELAESPESAMVTKDQVVKPKGIPAGPMVSGCAPMGNRPVDVEPPKEDEGNRLIPVQASGIKAVKKARDWKPVLSSRSKVMVPDSRSLIELAQELELALNAFRGPVNSSSTSGLERSNLVRTQLLGTLSEIEKRSFVKQDQTANHVLREVAFDWAESLLYELRAEQVATERGACLEGLAAVLESPCLSEIALANDTHHSVRFSDLMIKCMNFVMGKLGAKGVFHNTLLFSGRFLAFAFFRVPHVGEQLVTVLQPPRGALMRFTRATLMGSNTRLEASPQYPKHLAPLCFDNSQAYTARLASLTAQFATEAERDAFLFQPGNWLRRWQSDDSELFPAFYRAYHRQLSTYLGPAVDYYESKNQAVPSALLLRAPGYAHLATIFARKCQSYILGSINAVTTTSSNQNFDATESAGLKGSQKPAILETTNRRLTETISTLINTHATIPDGKGRVLECDGQHLWSSMLDLWMKNLISKTSLYAPKGVFSLFDLLDGIVDPPFDPLTGERRLKEVSLLDVPHLIHVTRLILNEAEHALTIVKVIAFVFTHWEVLTVQPNDRRELCLGLLLDKKLFERLTLFWSQSVRSYVLRLVVFRLGHVHTTKEDGVSHDIEIESVRLLQSRLEQIRKRYDELEPKELPGSAGSANENSGLSSPVDSNFPRSKSTIMMVTDSPRSGGNMNKAERLLGLGLGAVGQGQGSGANGLEVEDANSKMGKAKGWLKKSFANKKKGKHSPSLSSPSSSPSASPSLSPSPNFEASPLSSFASPLLPGAKTPGSLTGRKSKSPRPSLETPPTESSQRLPQFNPATFPARKPNENGAGAGRSDTRDKGGRPVVSLDSPVSEESSSPSDKKSRPPNILTPTPSHTSSSTPDRSPGFSFEFELPTTSPRSDTFDPTPTPSSPSANGAGQGRRNSLPPSPRQPQSPHMSRSFSKRSSLLPPNTASILANELSSSGSIRGLSKGRTGDKEDGYPKKLHAYAIRMLAELEDAQKEYDEWWSEGGIGKKDGAPPRLTVAWPFHEGDE